MTKEFLCVYCDTSLSWIDRGALEVTNGLFCFGLSFAPLLNFLYELLSLSLVNKGTFIVFSISPRQLKLLGRLSSIVTTCACSSVLGHTK